MQWIDIGANLTHESFDPDREHVIAHAHANGVTQMLITGASITGSAAAVQLAQRHGTRLLATAGVHPHHASELTDAGLVQLRELLARPEVIAVGECGLDYYRDLAPREQQRRAFEAQLQLAIECGKPLFLHQRDAHADFVALLRAHQGTLPVAVAHCFTAGERELEDYLALGLSIGITGWICDERRGSHLKSLVAKIPVGRLMLETDAPYLLPRDLAPKPKSRRNEPKFLPHIGSVVAAARGESPEHCAAHTSAHARAFFALPEPVQATTS